MYIKEIIESQIANENRHLFMYGYNSNKREQLLKGISEKYPFNFNDNKSCIVYIDEIGLPNITTNAKNLDPVKIKRIAISFLEFSIIQNIANRINNTDIKDDDRLSELIDEFNSISNIQYKNLDEIISSLEKSKKFYCSFYEEYLKTGNDEFGKKHFSDLDITFIPDLSMFVRDIQEATNNNASFQILLDRKEKIPVVSVMAINSIINMRCNKELSIKVACSPDEWETYADLNKSSIDYIHDYGILELDDSYNKYLKASEAKYNFTIDED